MLLKVHFFVLLHYFLDAMPCFLVHKGRAAAGNADNIRRVFIGMVVSCSVFFSFGSTVVGINSNVLLISEQFIERVFPK